MNGPTTSETGRRGHTRESLLPYQPPAELTTRALAAGVDLAGAGVPVVLLFPADPAEARTGLLALAFGVALACYHASLEALFGATVGKLVFGLRVVDARTGAKPSAIAALRRNLPRAVDVALAYLPGALSAWISPSNRSVGDRLAGTVVVAARAGTAPFGFPGLRDHRRRAEEEARRRREHAGLMGEEMVAGELERLARLDGDYYVWNDLDGGRGVGNIDHLVVGPGGITIIETKANRGLVSVGGFGVPTVDGRPLHRDVLEQVDRQRRAVLRRMGLGDVDPEKIVGYEWLICFPRGRLDPQMNPAVRRRLATTRDLRWRLRNQTPTATPAQLRDMVGAVSRMYGRGPDLSPPGRSPDEDPGVQAGPEGRPRGRWA
ncbi:hypothetical protein GBA63_21690 (plasmid) [Rubrobacter tropicus]|uniref:NERD domain-containing protein n=1 Tax=Rubrobacter tropicus TaxID=2653851 RepID=A0A6G8QFQ4_9ACTN|nr:RDD family protein [Rubrobacter tropicus]QIN85334.1 hypothetical protein GBA63_21690 [Rubrobacter tropicus]